MRLQQLVTFINQYVFDLCEININDLELKFNINIFRNNNFLKIQHSLIQLLILNEKLDTKRLCTRI